MLLLISKSNGLSSATYSLFDCVSSISLAKCWGLSVLDRAKGLKAVKDCMRRSLKPSESESGEDLVSRSYSDTKLVRGGLDSSSLISNFSNPEK